MTSRVRTAAAPSTGSQRGTRTNKDPMMRKQIPALAFLTVAILGTAAACGGAETAAPSHEIVAAPAPPTVPPTTAAPTTVPAPVAAVPVAPPPTTTPAPAPAPSPAPAPAPAKATG